MRLLKLQLGRPEGVYFRVGSGVALKTVLLTRINEILVGVSPDGVKVFLGTLENNVFTPTNAEEFSVGEWVALLSNGNVKKWFPPRFDRDHPKKGLTKVMAGFGFFPLNKEEVKSGAYTPTIRIADFQLYKKKGCKNETRYVLPERVSVEQYTLAYHTLMNTLI